MSRILLLDTHTILWSAHQTASLSRRAFDAIADGENRVLVSPVSAFEIATKSRRGRLEFDTLLARDFVGQLTARGFAILPIAAEHAQLAGNLAGRHKDPWDRLLAAQAMIEGLTLVTNDVEIGRLGAETYW